MGRLLVVIIAALALGVPIALGLSAPQTVSNTTLGPHLPNLENGRRIFFAGGCASCHATPGQDEPTLLGGGRELQTEFGTFRAPNISSHMTDGIGNWSEAQFASAMLKGTSPDGRHYYPAFPYTSYQRMRMVDVRDLFAFLKSLPAVDGRPAGHALSFPFNVRAGIGFWKRLYLDGRSFQPDRTRSETWNRGAYLVEGPGHCAECHSARDFLGGVIASRRYAGGPNPAGEGTIPNISQHEDALANWSEDDFARLLEYGETPGGDAVSGDMRLVVKNTSQLPAEDRAAMAQYLKSLPPVAGAAQN